MTIRDKYFGWKDIFFDRFVHCCNEKSDQPQGSNIPLAKINFDNKTGYVEDGTINIAELLQYLWINNKVYGCEYAPIDISSALQTLIRLTENAKHMFEDQPGVYDMIPYRGFFLRDDFLSGKDYSLDLDKIVSGMGGWYGEDEDPCYSMFVSQDQIWNLNPILKVLADEGSILAKELGYDINSYVSDNGYTIYNPYLSWINHYYHYCPTFNEDKLKPWDRVEDRENKFKMTDKVKRGANNWYYSGGNVKGMMGNHNLAQAIGDASFGMFMTFLEYKCRWYGVNLIKIDRFAPSSKTCGKCGYVYKGLKLSERSWTCPECGTHHDRDLNAACNIKEFGLKALPTERGKVKPVDCPLVDDRPRVLKSNGRKKQEKRGGISLRSSCL